MIVRNCKDNFGKITVAGLILLISGQAMMHMLINSGIGPLTGQTLPLISYGSSSFIVFCIAFGVILSISREAYKKIEKETKDADPIKMVHDSIREEIDTLERFESEI